MDRDEVFAILSEERDYQDQKWPKPKHTHEVAAYLVFMQGFLTKAIAAISIEDGDRGGLNYLRKVTALGVACMEENGAVRRGS